jgi:hypothetical protein
VAGECLDCGYIYYTETGQLKIKELNERRKDFMGKKPLKKLKKQKTKPW